MKKMEKEETYSLNEVLKMVPFNSYQTLRRYVDQGVLKAKKSGNGYSITEKDLQEFLANYKKSKS